MEIPIIPVPIEKGPPIIKFIKNKMSAIVPRYESNSSSRIKLFTKSDDEITLDEYIPKKINLGIKVQVPEGYELRIIPADDLLYSDGIMVSCDDEIDDTFEEEITLTVLFIGCRHNPIFHINKFNHLYYPDINCSAVTIPIITNIANAILVPKIRPLIETVI